MNIAYVTVKSNKNLDFEILDNLCVKSICFSDAFVKKNNAH